MKNQNKRKDPKTAMMLGIFPGLGFLYLENIKYFFVFMFLVLFPLIMVSTTGNFAILISLLLYALSIYYTNVLAVDTLRNQESYKKDPYLIMALSVVLDGLGQLKIKQLNKAYFMMAFGLTSCVTAWIILIMKFGVVDLFLATNETSLYTIVNLMMVWTIAAIPIKILSLIDAFYSTYHLYVAKK